MTHDVSLYQPDYDFQLVDQQVPKLILRNLATECRAPHLTNWIRSYESEAEAKGTLRIIFKWATYYDVKRFLVDNASCVTKVLSEIKLNPYPNFRKVLIRFEYDGCPEKHDEILLAEGSPNEARRVLWHRAWTPNDLPPDLQDWISTEVFVNDILKNERTCIPNESAPKAEGRDTNGATLWYTTLETGSNYPKEILIVTKAGLVALALSFLSAICIAILPLEVTFLGVIPLIGTALSAVLLYVAGCSARLHDASVEQSE